MPCPLRTMIRYVGVFGIRVAAFTQTRQPVLSTEVARRSFLRRRVFGTLSSARLLPRPQSNTQQSRAHGGARPPVHTGGSVSMNAKSVLFETTEREDV
jgi:hypothetical protein